MMEVVAEEHNLQAVLERELHGFDNDGLDFKQLEQYLTANDGDICFPDEVIPAIAYNNSVDQVQQQIQQQQQLQEQMKMHSNANKMPTPPTAQCSYAGTTYNKNASPQYISAQLPESPPDSGSEPYSPDNPDNKMGAISMSNIPYNQPNLSRHNSIQNYTHNNNYHDRHSSVPEYHEPPRLNHSPNTHVRGRALPPMSPHVMPASYNCSVGNQHEFPSKKRKYPTTPPGTLSSGSINPSVLNGLLNIKQEPDVIDFAEDYNYDMSESGPMFMDGPYQVIKWQAYQPGKWHVLMDPSYKELPTPSYRVDSDKGFNFSVPDDAFVCQKKNHFQVTVHVCCAGVPSFVKTSDGVKKVDNFFLHFFGIKMESPNQTIKIEQSQSDRSKRAFYPVKMDLVPEQTSKITVGRLHYSETTSNNMRKKGKPNPDQRYFMLVVALQAHCGDNQYLVAGHMSEKIIVRASNPGQFESDVDVQWQKGQTSDAIYHVGRIGVNTDRPEEALTVHGNLKLTGHLVQASDKRAKEDIQEVDTRDQLQRVAQLRIYQYQYTDEYAEHVGIPETERYDTGVLAQELREVLPDAVRETGDVMLPNGDVIDNFLVVNKDRIYMENLGAVKELCKLTDNLENRIDQLEKVNKKLTKIKRVDSVKSTASGRSLSSTITSISLYSRTSSMPSSKPCKKNKECHHHHKGRCYVPHKPSAGQEGSLCSNKLIQIAIITLVLVMAFCLVAITTLYIMETQQDDTRTTNPVASSWTGQTSRPPDTKPGSLPPVRPPSEDTSTTSKATAGKTKAHVPATTPSTLPSMPVLSPLTCLGDEIDCEPSTCCKNTKQEDDPGKGSTHKTQTNSKGGGTKQTDKDKDNDSVPKVGPAYNLVHPALPLETTAPAQEDFVKPTPARQETVIETNEIPNGDFSNYRVRKRRATEGYDLTAHSISITNYNVSVDSNYCSTRECVTGSTGNFSYLILLSRFTMEAVNLEFKVANNSKVQYCDIGEHLYDNTACGSPSVNADVIQYPGTNNIFSLPVQSSMQSLFRFRIHSLALEEPVCQLPVSSVKNQFTEYNFHFKIVCSNEAGTAQ